MNWNRRKTFPMIWSHSTILMMPLLYGTNTDIEETGKPHDFYYGSFYQTEG
jgi:hypothetical protein